MDVNNKEEILLWMREHGYTPLKEMTLEEAKFYFNIALQEQKDLLYANKPNRNAMLVNIIVPEF